MCPAVGGAEDIMRRATRGPPYGVLSHLFVGGDALIAPPYNAPASTVAIASGQKQLVPQSETHTYLTNKKYA